MMNPMGRIRLAIVNDHPIVVEGLRALLVDVPEVEVVELDTLVDVHQPVDVALLDTFGQSIPIGEAIRRRLAEPTIRRVVVFCWQFDQELVRQSLAAGASGVVSKTVGTAALVGHLESVVAGGQVVDRGDGATAPDLSPDPRPLGRDWPGSEHGLTMREGEMISLVCLGLSNGEICSLLFLSLNSVKSYIRTAYAKIGVTSRSQAVIWGIDHGMRPAASRQDGNDS